MDLPVRGWDSQPAVTRASVPTQHFRGVLGIIHLSVHDEKGISGCRCSSNRGFLPPTRPAQPRSAHPSLSLGDVPGSGAVTENNPGCFPCTRACPADDWLCLLDVWILPAEIGRAHV